MIDISGECAARFNAVKDVMAQSIAAGDDIGASFAVSLDGEMVVDIWGGTLDAEGTQAWQQDTIVNVYSTTKPMSFYARWFSQAAGFWILMKMSRIIGPNLPRTVKTRLKSGM